jgi:hypothetical protein
MKHLKNYKMFLENKRDIESISNEILDKISREGIDSLTAQERNFLDSMSDEEASQKALDDYNSKFYDETYESENGTFTFHLTSIESEDTESDDGIITTYSGTMTLSNNIMSETYEGTYQLNSMGIYMEDFYLNGNDIKDSELFIEKEYDMFLLELSMTLPQLESN